MILTPPPQSFAIGWDVGGWNCDKNPRSRDAVVILDASRTIVGRPWRGNLRDSILDSATSSEWVRSLFSLCAAPPAGESASFTVAIDAPLGFSDAFVRLVAERRAAPTIGGSDSNDYLFRRTERYLFENGRTPLSAVKDMIGSQATKGMHALAKFAPIVDSCGVWTDGAGLRVLETYPAACRNTKIIARMLQSTTPLTPDDVEDARICGLIAHLFAADRESLVPPGPAISDREGWIWLPALGDP